MKPNLKTMFRGTIVTLVLCGMSLSCSDDFLDQPIIGAYDDKSLGTVEGANSLLIGVYGQLNGVNTSFSGMVTTPWACLTGSIRGGEALLGTEPGDGAAWEPFPAWSVNSTTQFLPIAFTFYYNAIDMSNKLLTIIPTVTGMSDAAKRTMEAETKFLRAHYYFMLKRMFGNIPWVDENSQGDVRQPNTNPDGSYVDIWPQIEADMAFAAANLPPTQPNITRANSWAAKAYLAKLRMFQKKYDATTYDLVADVIANGVTAAGTKYNLMPSFRDNFDPDKENNVESVFQVQISVNDVVTGGGDVQNPQSTWMGFYAVAKPGVPAPGMGRGFGYFTPSQWFVDKFRVNNITGLPYLDYYQTDPNPVKNDYGLTDTDPFTPETKPLDPRLDWTVGRRGIPYLDWGVQPGAPFWKRDGTGRYSGPYLQKKWMYLKSKEGVHNQVGAAALAINGPVIRFADVLLLAAELEVRVKNNLPAAAALVDRVRARAAAPAGWPQNAAGTGPAANYKVGLYGMFTSTTQALDAILHERALELGLEGQRFYDVIRFGGDYVKKELVDYAVFQGQYTSYLKNAVFQVGVDELAPFHQTAIINSAKDGVPTLKQNPGY